MFKLLKKMFSVKTANTDPHISEHVFGTVQKFRIGSTVQISPVVTAMLPETSMVSTVLTDDYSAMIVDTILSFNFNGIKVFRLYCDNPQCLVQLTEVGDRFDAMLFVLSEEADILDEDEHSEWVETLSGTTVVDEQLSLTYDRIFGPVGYTEKLEADRHPDENDPGSVSKTMSLYGSKMADAVEEEYVLLDLNHSEWRLEGFVGINVPSQDIKIF